MPIDEIDEEMIKTKDLEIETNHKHEHEHEDGTKHSHEHTHSDDIEDHSHKHENKPKKESKKKEVVRPSSKTGIEIPKSAKICQISKNSARYLSSNLVYFEICCKTRI